MQMYNVAITEAHAVGALRVYARLLGCYKQSYGGHDLSVDDTGFTEDREFSPFPRDRSRKWYGRDSTSIAMHRKATQQLVHTISPAPRKKRKVKRIPARSSKGRRKSGPRIRRWSALLYGSKKPIHSLLWVERELLATTVETGTQ